MTTPELAQLALHLVSLLPHFAREERIWSSMNNTLTPRRNRLTDNKFLKITYASEDSCASEENLKEEEGDAPTNVETKEATSVDGRGASTRERGESKCGGSTKGRGQSDVYV